MDHSGVINLVPKSKEEQVHVHLHITYNLAKKQFVMSSLTQKTLLVPMSFCTNK